MSKIKFIKKMILMTVFITIFCGVGLYVYKFFTTKVHCAMGNNAVKIFKYKGMFYKYGNIREYPFLKISTDSINWETINVRGFVFDLLPSWSGFSNMQAIENTIWFYDRESCIECDCLQNLNNIFYSHDNGTTWSAIKVQDNCTFVLFTDDFNGKMIFGEGKLLITKDGGKTWVKRLSNDIP